MSPPLPIAPSSDVSLQEGTVVPSSQGWRGGWRQGLPYGALGLPLAFVALPLYVVLPNHYASEFGAPLALLGAVLLAARLLDAFADPWIGRFVDGWLAHSRRRVLGVAVVAAAVLAAGFAALFLPPVRGTAAVLAWCAAMLAVTYLAYSVLAVLHQAWGARLGGDEAQRAAIVSWREGLALVGVLVASVLPALAGMTATTVAFALLLAAGTAALTRAPSPDADAASARRGQDGPSLWQPLHSPRFRRLLLVYLVNGVASAVPATLVLFFVRDRLQAQAFEPLFLASYFAAGALSMPLWMQLVRRLGLARSWLIGMALAIAAFVWAAALGPGDVAAYTAVCIASGLALGADLTLPGALLAGVIQRDGHGGRLEGAYFGWWNFATKLNLALAAGLALPLLQGFGYAPGTQDEAGLTALTIAYCLLPCLLKAVAAGVLTTHWIRAENKDPTR